MPQITIGKGLTFYEEAQALPGVKRVAGMVKQDIELVTGVSPAGITSGQGSGCAVLYGTIGHSPMLDALEAQGKIALNAIRGNWECYSFQVIENPLAGINTALKVFPATANFENSEERPYLEYTFAAAKDGNYHVQFHMSATTPVTFEPKQYIGYSVNGGAVQVVNTVREENRPFFGSEQWYAEGFANVKLTEAVILCHAGVNTLRFYAVSPAIILEKIVLWPDGTSLPESYLGPRESYRC